MEDIPERSSPTSIEARLIDSSPGASSTSSKQSNHTLEKINTISYDTVGVSPTRTEPPRKRLKTNEDEFDTQSAASQLDELTGNTVMDEEINLICANHFIDTESLRSKLSRLEIIPKRKLPTDHDFITTQNMFLWHGIPFPVNMSSISVYKVSQNSSLTIGTVSLKQPHDLPNGIISLENAQLYNLYQGLYAK